MKPFVLSETPLGKFACLVVDLILLNILFILTSIPILTIGASFTALYASFSQRSRGETQMTRTYFSAFKKNFRSSLPIWILALIIGFVLYINFRIFDSWDSYRNGAFIVLGFLTAIYLSILSYAFPLLGEFETTFKQLLSNAILMSIAHFPKTILLLLINCFPILVLWLMPSWFAGMVFLWCPCAFSLSAYLNTRILASVFAPYRPEDDLEEYL